MLRIGAYSIQVTEPSKNLPGFTNFTNDNNACAVDECVVIQSMADDAGLELICLSAEGERVDPGGEL